MSKVVTIPSCITEIDPRRMYNVPVLIGAPEALVSCRVLRGHYCTKPGEKGYETNREIKIWSVFFQLKALTTSPFIKNWRRQRELLSTWLQMGEKIFYWYLGELKQRGLISIDRQFNIHLASWEQAAHILDIAYCGTYTIQFNPYKHEGKQAFQYLLRAEEIEANKKLQLQALTNNLDKNPLLKNDLIFLLVRNGADKNRLLLDRAYLQERLLKLQKQLFKDGSDLLSYVFTFRADINRGIRKLKSHHHYRSVQSVTYMKRRMLKLRVVELVKITVISKARSRFSIPMEEEIDKLRPGYKWFKDQKQTSWILTDQIKPNYESSKRGQKNASNRKAA